MASNFVRNRCRYFSPKHPKTPQNTLKLYR
jgi:hypothetical protein